MRLGFEYSPTGLWRGLHYTSGTAKQSFSLIQNAYADMPNQVLLSQHWQYDAKHRIADVKTTGLQTKQQGYLYDSRDHVISTFDRKQDNILQEKYFYDALGNRLMGQQLSSQTVGYHYQNSKLTTVLQDKRIASVTYNSMGQPIQYPTNKDVLWFSYINGQIIQVWQNEKLIAAYSYNDAGQRIKKYSMSMLWVKQQKILLFNIIITMVLNSQANWMQREILYVNISIQEIACWQP